MGSTYLNSPDDADERYHLHRRNHDLQYRGRTVLKVLVADFLKFSKSWL